VVPALLKLVAARFRTHGIAGIPGIQTRTAIYRDLHFTTTNAAILDEFTIERHGTYLLTHFAHGDGAKSVPRGTRHEQPSLISHFQMLED
jgi:hypothetical protein